MYKEKMADSLWFEDGSSIPLSYLLVDTFGKKHLAFTDSNGICPLYDFLCYRTVSATVEEVMELVSLKQIL